MILISIIILYLFSLLCLFFLEIESSRKKVSLVGLITSSILLMFFPEWIWFILRVPSGIILISFLFILKDYLYKRFSFYREVMSAFNTLNIPPENRYFFLLRKYRGVIIFLSSASGFLSGYLTLTGKPVASLIFLSVSFLASIIYFIQSVNQIKVYYSKETKGDKRFFSVTNTVVICKECLSGIITVVVSAELGWKLYSGTLNSVPPWRSYRLNQQFPEDDTKLWTESKAFWYSHNKSMGRESTQTEFQKFAKEVLSGKE